jgi:ammonia channel protein AmtB
MFGILYLGQGLGVGFSLLLRPGMPPFARMLTGMVAGLTIITPGVNVVVLGALLILGIAETWVPFRAPKKSGPPSTPTA